jgi:orotate phosphoribosyltransferase
MPITSSYLPEICSGVKLKKIVAKLSQHILDSGIVFQAIAVRGFSSSFVSAPIAAELKKNLIIVRKSSKGHHSNTRVEGYQSPKSKRLKYIIVDDFISTGKTIATIIKDVHEIWDRKAICTGVFLYRECESYCRKDWVDECLAPRHAKTVEEIQAGVIPMRAYNLR